jgi:hypothetical protein
MDLNVATRGMAWGISALMSQARQGLTHSL